MSCGGEQEEGGDGTGEAEIEEDDLLLADSWPRRPGHVGGANRQREAVGEDHDEDRLDEVEAPRSEVVRPKPRD